uniref:CHHC U11-48K-type domain-containing protein n=1 Tax=Anopheles christyi TaxID=43041 RepID=A0A182K499_9DIPT
MSNLKQCPFDVTHLVEGKSFPMHLVKCQRQHPHIKLAKCHLDTSHLMREEELQQHMKTCPSREQLDLYKYNLTTAASSLVSSMPDPADDLIINTTGPSKRRGGGGVTSSTTVGRTLMDDSECWDDSACKAYNPLESCLSKKNENSAFILPKVNQFVEQSTAAAVLKKERRSNAGDGEKVKPEPSSDEDFGSSMLNERQNDLEQFGMRRNTLHGEMEGRVGDRYREIKKEPSSSPSNGSRDRDDRNSGERPNSHRYEAGERSAYNRRSDSSGYRDRERHRYDRRNDGYSSRDRYERPGSYNNYDYSDSRNRRDGYDSVSKSYQGYGRHSEDNSSHRSAGNERYNPYGRSYQSQDNRTRRTGDFSERGDEYPQKHPKH